MREFRPSEIEFKIEAEQGDVPVKGNAIASGDDDFDRQVEEKILGRLDRGEVWAWACVTVTASWGCFEGVDYLGACSYKDEESFTREVGYVDDMIKAAVLDLIQNVKDAGWTLINTGDFHIDMAVEYGLNSLRPEAEKCEDLT